MAISPKMLAVLQKVDAARAEFFDGLRESAKQEAEAKVRAKKRAASAAQARSVTKKEVTPTWRSASAIPRKPFTPPFTSAERALVVTLHEKLERARQTLERKAARKRKRS